MAIAFDARALLAHAREEDGADVVEEYLMQVSSGARVGICNVVNLAEVDYVLRRQSPRGADGYLQWVLDAGVQPASADRLWREAAAVKAAHPISLADAFAIVTAKDAGAVLVTGSDPDFDVAAALGVKVHRIA